MPTWPALVVAPLLALADQAVSYALVVPACRTQRDAWLHAVPAAFVALSLLLTLVALAEARRLRRAGAAPLHVDNDRAALRRYFVACVAVGTGALSTLAILAMWFPQWVLPACLS